MAKNTINDIVSRIRVQLKAVRQDSFMTDRMVYTFVLKNAKFLMKREDSKNKLMAFSSVIQTMDFVELIEVDRVEACCTGVRSDCTIKRTKEKLPIFLEGYFGPLIRTIASLDGSEELQPILPTTYSNLSQSKNFRFNKTKYYWFIDDYLYFPNLQWDAVRIEGIFEDDITIDQILEKTKEIIIDANKVIRSVHYANIILKEISALQQPSPAMDDKKKEIIDKIDKMLNEFVKLAEFAKNKVIFSNNNIEKSIEKIAETQYTMSSNDTDKIHNNAKLDNAIINYLIKN
jgi:hypothetical protein